MNNPPNRVRPQERLVVRRSIGGIGPHRARRIALVEQALAQTTALTGSRITGRPSADEAETAINREWNGPAGRALSGRASKHEEHAAKSQNTNAVTVRTIGIDTGKNTFYLIGLDEQGTIVLREKLAHGRIGRRLANASPCLIGIEAGMQSAKDLAFCANSSTAPRDSG